MAQDSDSPKENLDLSAAARLEFAVREIEQSANLRFFFREFLSFCGVLHPSSVFDPDPRIGAYNAGVHGAGVEIARMLTSAAPLLLPALMIEDMTHVEDEVATAE